MLNFFELKLLKFNFRDIPKVNIAIRRAVDNGIFIPSIFLSIINLAYKRSFFSQFFLYCINTLMHGIVLMYY